MSEHPAPTTNLTHRTAWTTHSQEPFYVFERCDIIALPSFKEGLPNVLLEALAMEVRERVPCDQSGASG